jgi:hypothetical protein
MKNHAQMHPGHPPKGPHGPRPDGPRPEGPGGPPPHGGKGLEPEKREELKAQIDVIKGQIDSGAIDKQEGKAQIKELRSKTFAEAGVDGPPPPQKNELSAGHDCEECDASIALTEESSSTNKDDAILQFAASQGINIEGKSLEEVTEELKTKLAVLSQ